MGKDTGKKKPHLLYQGSLTETTAAVVPEQASSGSERGAGWRGTEQPLLPLPPSPRTGHPGRLNADRAERLLEVAQ